MVNQSMLFVLLTTLFQLLPTNGQLRSPVIRYKLADETPSGSLIGNIVDQLPLEGNRAYTFLLLSSNNFPYMSDYFHISNQGELTTLQHIDRDDRNNICGPLACCNLLVCQINATIVINLPNNSGSGYNSVASTHEQQHHVRLEILIKDANDNVPYFLPSDSPSSQLPNSDNKPFYIYLREGDTSRLEPLPLASDIDSIPNGVIEYRLEELKYSGMPRMNVTTDNRSPQTPTSSDNSPLVPQLLLLRDLDYEHPEDRQINAILLAIDGGRPSLTGTLSLVINLLDVNDNAPSFKNNGSPQRITIPESTSIDSGPIYRLSAIDADSGENGRISYALSPLSGPDVRRKFKVNSSTGSIELNEELDYEVFSQRRFTIPLIARDNGHVRMSSTTSLFVRITDVNDNSPTLIVQENVTVPEGEVLVKPVIKFYVKDEDDVSKDKVTCQLAKPNKNQLEEKELRDGDKLLRLQAVSDNVFFIFTKGLFDYEQTPRASLLINCIDAASSVDDSKRNQQLRLTVAVQDRNDNAPRFLQAKYTFALIEHSPPGTKLGRVEAVDADSGEFGQLTYSLSSSTRLKHKRSMKHCLIIDSQSGEISVHNSSCLDREVAGHFSFYVEAKDKGGLTSASEIVVQLSDINDNAPRLVGNSEFYLQENQRVDTIIGSVQFSDPDSNRNARIHLTPSTSAGTEILKYIRLARDPKFRYIETSSRLSDPSTYANDFAGDELVHALLISQMPIDRELTDKLNFEVIAWDEGEPSLSVTVNLPIIITDQNDNYPKLTYPVPDSTIGISSPSIHTNSPINTVVCQVKAVDLDQGKNGSVQFDLLTSTNGSALFKVNVTSGLLSTDWLPLDQALKSDQSLKSQIVRQPRQPEPGIYTIRLGLKDQGHPPLTGQFQFHVKISEADPTIEYSPVVKSFETKPLSTQNRDKISPLLLTVLISSICFLIIISILAVLCYTKIYYRSNKGDHRSTKQYRVSRSKDPLGSKLPDEHCSLNDVLPGQPNGTTYQEPTFFSFDSPNPTYQDAFLGDTILDNLAFSPRSPNRVNRCNTLSSASYRGSILDANTSRLYSSLALPDRHARSPLLVNPSSSYQLVNQGTFAGQDLGHLHQYVGSEGGDGHVDISSPLPAVLGQYSTHSIYATRPRTSVVDSKPVSINCFDASVGLNGRIESNCGGHLGQSNERHTSCYY